MPARIEVEGLKQALDNMKKLNVDVQHKISRDALREAGWTLAGPMRAATYTTFQRITGAIRHGLSVAVQREPNDDKLKAYVVEYPQQIVGAETPFKALIRKRRTSRKRSTSIAGSTAYWWRFLEKGTGPRRASATPKFLRSGKVSKSAKVQTRQLSSVTRWKASASRGGIKARPWLAPAFNANAEKAITVFRATVLKLIDAAVSAMPKR